MADWRIHTLIRETAYLTDVRIANEMITGNRDRLLAKGIDKLLGHLDMLNNGQSGCGTSLHGWFGDGNRHPLLRYDGGGRQA